MLEYSDSRFSYCRYGGYARAEGTIFPCLVPVGSEAWPLDLAAVEMRISSSARSSAQPHVAPILK